MNMHLKTPIGLDGIAAAETALSHVDGEHGELIIAGERVATWRPDKFRGRDGTAYGAAAPARRSARPRCAQPWARPGSAPSPVCRSCWERRAICRSSTASAPLSPLCAPKTACA